MMLGVELLLFGSGEDRAADMVSARGSEVGDASPRNDDLGDVWDC